MDEDLTFGAWLKRRRRALDMTQRDLADRVACAVGTVRRLESDDLRPSRQIAERLADVLAIPVVAREPFIAFARDHPVEFRLLPEPTPAGATPAPPSSLPQSPTPLIGRAHTVAAIATLLLRPDVRLVTLTGPPGVGKTRLGLKTAAEVAGRFADGVVFVPLAPIVTPDLLVAALAQALGLHDGERPRSAALIDRLADRALLLLIDNMEHLVAAAPLLAQLLAAAPRFKLLVTSRVSLRLAGEYEFAVPPLSLPEATASDPLELAQSPAVALFCMRARAVRADFALDAGNAVAIATICRRLDGLPLAIELAAMRGKLFSPQALLDRLEPRLPLLAGGPRDLPARQQTVEAAIAWSYDLLTAEQQHLFACLGVFSGGWLLEAAEALMHDETRGVRDSWQMVDALAALVDHSLVRQTPDADRQPRFSMLEVIREYALARLAQQDQATSTQARHAAIYLALARASQAGLRGRDQLRWMAILDAEIDNIRGALAWSISASGNLAPGLGLAAALWWFWWISGRLAEGRHWLDELLAREDTNTPDRAEALTGAASLAFSAGDFAGALPLSEQAIVHSQALGLSTLFAYAQLLRGSILILEGNPAGAELAAASATLLRTTGANGAWYLGITLIVQTIMAMNLGDLEAAGRYIAEALTIFRQLGQPYGIASSLNYLGDVARLRGDWASARAAYEASLTLMRESGVRSDLPALLHNLGYVALATGDVARAHVLIADSLALHRETGNHAGVAESLYGLAAVAVTRGHPLQAARLFGAAAAAAESSDMPAWAAEGIERERYMTAARAQLTEADWAAAVEAGHMFSLDQALAELS